MLDIKMSEKRFENHTFCGVYFGRKPAKSVAHFFIKRAIMIRKPQRKTIVAFTIYLKMEVS